MSAMPIPVYRATIAPEWIDPNGHMSVAGYGYLFWQASMDFLAHLGIGYEAVQRTNKSMFTLQWAIAFEREVGRGAPIAVSHQVLDYDAKRIHYFGFMRHAEDGFLAATHEMLDMHVDLGTRKSVPMAAEQMRLLEEIWAVHKDLPRPRQAGAPIAIRRAKA